MEVDGGDQEEARPPSPKPYLPGGKLEEGEFLAPDLSTYPLLHSFVPTWPSLSFDILRDNDGEERRGYPVSCALVAGTQAQDPTANEVTVMRWESLGKTRRDESASPLPLSLVRISLSRRTDSVPPSRRRRRRGLGRRRHGRRPGPHVPLDPAQGRRQPHPGTTARQPAVDRPSPPARPLPRRDVRRDGQGPHLRRRAAPQLAPLARHRLLDPLQDAPLHHQQPRPRRGLRARLGQAHRRRVELRPPPLGRHPLQDLPHDPHPDLGHALAETFRLAHRLDRGHPVVAERGDRLRVVLVGPLDPRVGRPGQGPQERHRRRGRARQRRQRHQLEPVDQLPPRVGRRRGRDQGVGPAQLQGVRLLCSLFLFPLPTSTTRRRDGERKSPRLTRARLSLCPSAAPRHPHRRPSPPSTGTPARSPRSSGTRPTSRASLRPAPTTRSRCGTFRSRRTRTSARRATTPTGSRTSRRSSSSATRASRTSRRCTGTRRRPASSSRPPRTGSTSSAPSPSPRRRTPSSFCLSSTLCAVTTSAPQRSCAVRARRARKRAREQASGQARTDLLERWLTFTKRAGEVES